MKRTKSMIYNPTDDSKELSLYVENTGVFYEKFVVEVIKNLQNKAQKGLYDTQKVIDAWYHVACAASKSYNKDFGGTFSVQDRFTAAVEMEKIFKEQIFENVT